MQPAETERSPIDFARLYEYRFRHVDEQRKREVWSKISRFVWETCGRPDRVLDIAAGAGEFIGSVPAPTRWAIDAFDSGISELDGVHAVISPIEDFEPDGEQFDLVFVSNLLEHLGTPEAVARLLSRARSWTKEGGQIVVIGPNFRHCAREYFDFADHSVVLTERSVAEHLHAAGWEVERVEARFLPYSFTSRLPSAAWLVEWYLRFPLAWRLVGKQFLVIARN